MSSNDARSPEELLEQVRECEERAAKAEAARDALVREVLPLSQRRPEPAHSPRRGRILALATALVMLSGATFLLVQQLGRGQRMLGAKGRAMKARRREGAPRLRSSPRPPVIRPRRKATLPIPGVSLLWRAALGAAGERAALAGWGEVLLFDLRADRPLWRAAGHAGAVRDVVFDARAGVISGGEDRKIKRWRAKDGKLVETLVVGASVRDLDRANDILAVGVEAPSLALYRLEGKKTVLLRKVGGHRSWVRAVALSADGRRVAAGDHSGKVRVYAVASGELLRELDAGAQWTNALAFSPDGRLLAAASFDKRTRIFELKSGSLRHSFRGHSRRVVHLAFSRDGRRLATASHDRTAVIWDLVSGRLARRLAGHAFTVSSVAFFPSGDAVLTASTDGALRLWPGALPVAESRRAVGDLAAGELILRSNTTGERVKVKVMDGEGRVVESGRRRLAYIMRSGPDDRRRLPHPELVEALYRAVEHFGREREVRVISGFRSDEFNRLRTKQSRQVAKKSRHRKGEAIDFRIEGVSIARLKAYLVARRIGGVGYYPDSKFVHLDVGPVRSWGGD